MKYRYEFETTEVMTQRQKFVLEADSAREARKYIRQVLGPVGVITADAVEPEIMGCEDCKATLEIHLKKRIKL
jgi:hypothetical protein